MSVCVHYTNFVGVVTQELMRVIPWNFIFSWNLNFCWLNFVLYYLMLYIGSAIPCFFWMCVVVIRNLWDGHGPNLICKMLMRYYAHSILVLITEQRRCCCYTISCFLLGTLRLYTSFGSVELIQITYLCYCVGTTLALYIHHEALLCYTFLF